jgi:hypothetical protein
MMKSKACLVPGTSHNHTKAVVSIGAKTFIPTLNHHSPIFATQVTFSAAVHGLITSVIPSQS